MKIPFKISLRLLCVATSIFVVDLNALDLKPFPTSEGPSRWKCATDLTNQLLKSHGQPNVTVGRIRIPQETFASYNYQPYYKVSFDVNINSNGINESGTGQADVFFVKKDGLSGPSWECGISQQGQYLLTPREYENLDKTVQAGNQITPQAANLSKLEKADLLQITSQSGRTFRLYGAEVVAIENPVVVDRNRELEIEKIEYEEKKRNLQKLREQQVQDWVNASPIGGGFGGSISPGQGGYGPPPATLGYPPPVYDSGFAE